MTNDYYQLALPERQRLLSAAGFVRNELRVWAHADGRAIGEGVAAALTDAAFYRFLHIEAPAPQSGKGDSRLEPPVRTIMAAEGQSTSLA